MYTQIGSNYELEVPPSHKRGDRSNEYVGTAQITVDTVTRSLKKYFDYPLAAGLFHPSTRLRVETFFTTAALSSGLFGSFTL